MQKVVKQTCISNLLYKKRHIENSNKLIIVVKIDHFGCTSQFVLFGASNLCFKWQKDAAKLSTKIFKNNLKKTKNE